MLSHYRERESKSPWQPYLERDLFPNSEWLESSDGSAQDQSMNVMSSCWAERQNSYVLSKVFTNLKQVFKHQVAESVSNSHIKAYTGLCWPNLHICINAFGRFQPQ